MSKLPPKSATLYITPSDDTLRIGPASIECLYLTMHLTKKASDEYRRRTNKWSSNTYGWRIKVPAAVPFSRERPLTPVVLRPDAPVECWAVLDLNNGHPEIPDGKQYLFVFSKLELAQAYVAYAETQILGLVPGVTDISKPFKLYQCG